MHLGRRSPIEMQPSVAVAEALEAGRLLPLPSAGVVDFAVAVLAVAAVALAVVAWFALASFDARVRRVVDLGPSLRFPRTLLVFFVGLLAAAETLRLPFLRRALFPAGRHVIPCLAYSLIAHGVAEPGLLATMLLLLRASAYRGGTGARRAPAAAAVPLSCLPFLAAHVAVLAAPASVAPYPGELARAADGDGHCAYPAYAGTLLIALAAVYAPLVASACCRVARVAINRRLHARAYALAALVAVPLPVQAVALALTSLWGSAPTVGLVGFVGVAVTSAAALFILVLLPLHDALGLVEQLLVVRTGEELSG